MTLRELIAKATPGPWRTEEHYISIVVLGGRGVVADAQPENARLIVAAVNRAPALLAALEAADAMRKRGVEVSHDHLVPPYGDDQKTIGEFLEIFDGPLQRAYDAARDAVWEV